jgi:hypothetical protein
MVKKGLDMLLGGLSGFPCRYRCPSLAPLVAASVPLA